MGCAGATGYELTNKTAHATRLFTPHFAERRYALPGGAFAGIVQCAEDLSPIDYKETEADSLSRCERNRAARPNDFLTDEMLLIPKSRQHHFLRAAKGTVADG